MLRTAVECWIYLGIKANLIDQRMQIGCLPMVPGMTFDLSRQVSSCISFGTSERLAGLEGSRLQRAVSEFGSRFNLGPR